MILLCVKGEFTNAISIRDLRGIGVDGPFFSRLFRTVKDFNMVRKGAFSRSTAC